MFTLAAFAIMAFVVIPAFVWVLELVCRLVGWTMRMVFGVLLLPVWIMLAVVGGLAFALKALLPIAVVLFVLSLLVPEG